MTTIDSQGYRLIPNEDPSAVLLAGGRGRDVSAPRLTGHAGPAMQARVLWFAVAGLITGSLAVWANAHGGIGNRATEASLVSLVIAMLARHDGVMRGVFVLGRWFPSYRAHQLTYHVGQLHRAMAVAASVWFAMAVVVGARQDALGGVLGAVTLVVLGAMICTARDAVRHGRHDRFEAVHRYGGWAALALVTALVLREVLGSLAIGDPAGLTPVALLTVLVGLVVHPWASVRRVPVEVLDVTDQVVVLSLHGSRRIGEFIRVSRGGSQWHSFAVATVGEGEPGRYSLVIRRAGDWTEQLARDAEEGTLVELRVRNLRGYGFMYHAQTFRRVLFLATGAGIGPVLPYLLDDAPMDYECLWIGREHATSMGSELVARVLAGGGVTLVDTSAGRPDIAQLVAARARQVDAVFVVSNDAVRDEVARVCERLRIPWYGPTFDS